MTDNHQKQQTSQKFTASIEDKTHSKFYLESFTIPRNKSQLSPKYYKEQNKDHNI